MCKQCRKTLAHVWKIFTEEKIQFNGERVVVSTIGAETI